MQFSIEKLILWPATQGNQVHTLPFEHGKINVVHGRSGTGKSSIIAIIDYCLGASRCAIPVGIIRDSVAWFGLQVSILGTAYIVARRTPGLRQISNDFVLHPFQGEIPDTLTRTHNEQQFKQAFNNLTRLTNLPLSQGEEIGQHEGRPSFRDLAAFNFLPQHIVANPNTLFFKADSYDHKERLKKVMPFALGIINGEYILKERQRSQLQRQLDDLTRQFDIRKKALASWEAEVNRLWSDAVELGLADVESDDTTEKKLASIKTVNTHYQEGKLGASLQAPSYDFTNEKYKEAKAAEERFQALADDLRREIRGYERLSKRANDFSSAVEIERERAINLDWLKSKVGGENECVVCGAHSNQLHNVIGHLESEVKRVNDLSQVLLESPIVDKEIETAKAKLFEVQERLHVARTNRLHFEKIDSASKDSLSRVYVLLGRIQALLITFASVDDTDDLVQRIAELEGEIRKLDTYFRNSDRAAKERKVDGELSSLIEMYADGFGLEKRGKIRLDKTELTLSFQSASDEKKEYLWEVGSGANWMGYHVATFLALHQFLTTEESSSSPVFSFLVIDQPSQVYFPSASSGVNQLDSDSQTLAKLRVERDEDVRATKKIFEMLAKGLKAAGRRYQIIVLEHADESIWGGIENVQEAANWKAVGTGLIPNAWLQ